MSTTDFRDSPLGLFSAPPQGMMHRQASFIPAFFCEGTGVGEDVDFFYVPSYAHEELGNPVLGAEHAGVDHGRLTRAARGLIAFLETLIAHELWMAFETQGCLPPYAGVPRSRSSSASRCRRSPAPSWWSGPRSPSWC
nr:hypothetical protein [Jannaschia seohaensis]